MPSVEAPCEQHLADFGVADAHDFTAERRPLLNRSDQPTGGWVRGKHRNRCPLLKRMHHRINVRQRYFARAIRQEVNGKQSGEASVNPACSPRCPGKEERSPVARASSAGQLQTKETSHDRPVWLLSCAVSHDGANTDHHLAGSVSISVRCVSGSHGSRRCAMPRPNAHVRRMEPFG